MSTGSYEWPYVLNLGNSMLGVPMLAMPYCIQECGCLLGVLVIFVAGYLSVESSIFLLRTAQVTETYSYERTAEDIYGRFGKSFISACIIAFIFGIAVASFVIIGDIIPDILKTHFPATESILFKEQVIVIFAILIIFPLCLIRQVERLVPFSIFSLFTYALLIAYLFMEAFYFNPKSILEGKVKFFDFSGVLICTPIVMTGFSCQAQVLIYLETFPDTMKGVQEVKPLVVRSMLLVCIIYTAIGLFGYFTFINNKLETDLFENLSTSFLHQILRLAFCTSVIISYPMLIFPMRSCIYSMIYSRGQIATDILIPKFEFGVISLVIIIGSIIVAVLVPDIGIILNVTGGYAGAFLSFICPAMMFIKKSTTHDHIRGAKLILFIGILSLLSSPTLIFFQNYNAGSETIIDRIDENLPVKILGEQKLAQNLTDIKVGYNQDETGFNSMKEGRDILFFGNKTKIQEGKNRNSNKTFKHLNLDEDEKAIQDRKNRKSKKKIEELDLYQRIRNIEDEIKTYKTVKKVDHKRNSTNESKDFLK